LVQWSGWVAFEQQNKAQSQLYSYENRGVSLDPKLETVFRHHAAAWKFFEAQPPSYRVTAAFWVMSAKREETKKRRLEKLIAHSKMRERVPPFSSSPRSSGRGPRPAS